jgi:hypothetical protein
MNFFQFSPTLVVIAENGNVILDSQVSFLDLSFKFRITSISILNVMDYFAIKTPVFKPLIILITGLGSQLGAQNYEPSIFSRGSKH